ncbi:hypothetical protein H2198_005740 [Neophaeococcomyces mojaviensis]|uniref:Uncharacterized protein n=1 Tax=Neophaeococcomyces mojaviensis TaxID=3383035 RepID=A0ACC3A598_9EURO|nr:hypothetical protein H2198_005740 [Knufia sp. JES_112]
MPSPDNNVMNPIPLTPEPVKPLEPAGSKILPSQASSQAVSQTGNALGSKLSPEKRAKIDAKYRGKRLKNESKYQEKCETLTQDHPNEKDDTRHKKQQKIDERAKSKGDKIDRKHARKIDRAEKRAEVDNAERTYLKACYGSLLVGAMQ